jgi:hypothetical protein
MLECSRDALSGTAAIRALERSANLEARAATAATV